MKKFNLTYSFLLLHALALIAFACGDEDVNPQFEELRNESFDLVVVSDANQYVPVTFSVAGNDLAKVEVEIIPETGGEVVASNSLSNITSNSLNRVTLNVPFPTNTEAPSGAYIVKYKVTRDGGTETTESYTISVINNYAPNPCIGSYTQDLPAGKSTWIRLYLPNANALPEGDKDIFLTGSFEAREGGTGDWTGGGGASPFKFNRISENCYELAVNLQSGDNYKFTRGSWDKEIATDIGEVPGDEAYNGQNVISKTIYNFKDQETIFSETLNIPAGAIMSGMVTVVVDGSSLVDVNSGDYYIIEEDATTLEGGYKLIPFEGVSKLAVAIPKETGVNYVVVRNEPDNLFADGQKQALEAFSWDGETNPIRVAVERFAKDPVYNGDKLVIVGAATPDGWTSDPASDQVFTKIGPGQYEITIDLTNSSEGFLILPDFGDWGNKFAYGSGTSLQGTFAPQGSGENFNSSDLTPGTYKISVDFTEGQTGSYTLNLQ
jgi:hypothetical protein